MTRVAIGLGSNLGDRLATLGEAARQIASSIAPIEAASWVYETAPVGPPQPHYLNAALLLRWPSERWPSEDLPDLLARLLAVELSLGRVRAERWGARTIDLDILWAEGTTLTLPDLTVPHPRLHERPFALLPLLDIAPDAPYAVPATAPGEIERFAPASDWLPSLVTPTMDEASVERSIHAFSTEFSSAEPDVSAVDDLLRGRR